MIDLGPAPKTSPHLMADFLELAVFSGAKDEISVDEAMSMVAKGTGDLEDIGEQEEDLLQELSSAPPSAPTPGAERSDREHALAQSWFSQISYRQHAFGNQYPFSLGKYRILRLVSPLRREHFLYLFLLVCSRMKLLKGEKRVKSARHFEELSAQVLKRLFHPKWMVRQFGPTTRDRKRHFSAKLKLAIPELALELGELPLMDIIGELKENNVGDGGLDVFAYMPWVDTAPGRLILFAQCAARMEEWPEKILESHAISWRRYINFTHEPVNVVFVPVCYRKSDGNWETRGQTMNAVLVDRLRFCHSLRKAGPLPMLPVSELKAYSKIMVDPARLRTG